MSRWRHTLTTPPELRDADPVLLTPADPWSGDEAVVEPADYDDYVQRSGLPPGALLPLAEHDALDAEFCALYRRILDGQAPWSSIRPAAHRLRIDHPRRSDTRPLNRALQPLPDAIFAAMAEDQVPDIGVLAPDRVLGPFAEERLPRRLHRLAGAVMAFAPILHRGSSPIARAIYQKPRPPTSISSVVRAAARTPPMLWRLDSLAPALPLAAQMHPQGDPRLPLDLPAGAAAVLGRAIPLEGGGWWMAGVLPLPSLPDPAILERRLTLEVWRLRRHDRRLTWEDALRERGEVLYRTACEWSWWFHRDATLACWRDWSIVS